MTALIAILCATLPADLSKEANYLQQVAAWRESVVSYYEDGPSLFNVAATPEGAYDNAALKLVIDRDGFKVSKKEIGFIHALVESGNEMLISQYADYLRARRVSELRYSVEQIKKVLAAKELEDERHEFMTAVLKRAEARLEKLDDDKEQEYSFGPPRQRDEFRVSYCLGFTHLRAVGLFVGRE